MILPSISIQRTHHASQWRKWLYLETINLGIFELRAIFVKRYHAAHVAWEMPPKCIDTCWIRMTFFRKRAIQLFHKEAGSHSNKVMNHIHQGRLVVSMRRHFICFTNSFILPSSQLVPQETHGTVFPWRTSVSHMRKEFELSYIVQSQVQECQPECSCEKVTFVLTWQSVFCGKYCRTKNKI